MRLACKRAVFFWSDISRGKLACGHINLRYYTTITKKDREVWCQFYEDVRPEVTII